jgi:hypothetical protein
LDPKENGTQEQEVQGESDNMVELHEASIQDIDAELQRQTEAESVAVESEAPPVEPDSEEPNTKPVAQSEGEPEKALPQEARAGADPSKPERHYTPDEIQGIIAENKRLKDEGNQKELFIQKRGTELGMLRKENDRLKAERIAERARLVEGLDDKFAENPTQALADRDRIKNIDQDILAIDQHSAEAEQIVEAQTFFLRNVDTEKVSIDDMSEMLKDDGVPEDYIAAFKGNPWKFTTPEALVQMGKRAMERKEFKSADSDRRILAAHILKQNEEIARLKGRPAQVIQNVQKRLNAAPPVTSASAKAPTRANVFDDTTIAKMSEADLNAALQHATRH